MTTIDFFNYLIRQGHTDADAKAIIGRFNSYKETAKDKAIYKAFKESLQRAGSERQDSKCILTN